VGDTLTAEDFDCLWANREKAYGLVLALTSPSGRHSHNEIYKHLEWISDLDSDLLYSSSRI